MRFPPVNTVIQICVFTLIFLTREAQRLVQQIPSARYAAIRTSRSSVTPRDGDGSFSNYLCMFPSMITAPSPTSPAERTGV